MVDLTVPYRITIDSSIDLVFLELNFGFKPLLLILTRDGPKVDFLGLYIFPITPVLLESVSQFK